MELFQVTLKQGEDIDAFYDDMETPGGALTIPDRKVDCGERRPTSRTTGYMLTLEEAQEVADDDRVEVVVPQSVLDRIVEKPASTFTGRFDKGVPSGSVSFTKANGTSGTKYSVDHKNWGILRHIEPTNRTNWSSLADPISDRYVDDSVTYSASGKNVDIVIVELETLCDHEDYSNRIVDYNWGQHYNTIDGGTNYTYSNADARDNYSAQGHHPTAVTSYAAGTLYGLANNANIYMYDKVYERSKSGGSNTDRTFAYIREFHRTKAVNPATGRKNPTIVNLSLSTQNTITGGANLIHFQGVTLDNGSGNDLSEAELTARGIGPGDLTWNSDQDFEVNSSSPNSDLQDAITEGVIVVSGGGNDNRYIDVSGGDNWDNYIVGELEYPMRNYFVGGYYPFRNYYHRGDTYSFNGAINVGSFGTRADNGKSSFSCWGPGVDIYAAGEAVFAAAETVAIIFGGIPYPGQENNTTNWDTIGVGSGTSYSSPFIAGMLACLAEIYPTLTQAQAKAYLYDNAVTGLMEDTTEDITGTTRTRVSLDGSDIDRIALWKNHRATSGNMAFNTYNKDVNTRPTSGVMYPRTRTRRRG